MFGSIGRGFGGMWRGEKTILAGIGFRNHLCCLRITLCICEKLIMTDLPRHVVACLYSGKLACLAMLVSSGIVLQILACALYNNWWPMLSALTYVFLPMPLMFFAGSDTSIFSESESSIWMDITKFLTGASAVGSIAIPVILKHAGLITWGALAMDLSSLFVFVLAILCFLGMNDNNGGYSMI